MRSVRPRTMHRPCVPCAAMLRRSQSPMSCADMATTSTSTCRSPKVAHTCRLCPVCHAHPCMSPLHCIWGRACTQRWRHAPPRSSHLWQRAWITTEWTTADTSRPWYGSCMCRFMSSCLARVYPSTMRRTCASCSNVTQRGSMPGLPTCTTRNKACLDAPRATRRASLWTAWACADGRHGCPLGQPSWRLSGPRRCDYNEVYAKEWGTIAASVCRRERSAGASTGT